MGWGKRCQSGGKAALIEISPAGFAALPPLAAVPLFTGFIAMVLQGKASGRVWTAGRAAHGLHDYGMSLVWGEGVDRSFAALCEHLRDGAYRRADEWLQVDPRWGHLDWDGALAAERQTRLNFGFDRVLFDARHGDAQPPPGFAIVPLGEDGFDLADVHVTPHAFWRDFAACQAQGGGVCAVKNGEVAAIAFAATRADDWLEIGIETRAAYRGLGLARAVAVAMIRKCLAAGLTPIWACRKENTGSLHLAQSLGFVVSKEVPFWRLAA